MRIYLDNAATSWPKPEAVYTAVDHYQRTLGASAGRGSYSTAQQAARVVTETRSACARLLGVPNPNSIAFTSGGTASLNLAIHGLLRPGEHVVTTVTEHNSVLRPLYWQAEHNNVEVDYVGCDPAGYVDPNDIAAAFRPNTRLVVINHASNVTGAIQPLAEIVQLAHKAGALVLVDAAQTAGCIPINIAELDVDLFACGGHKGLLGPLGIGLLYVRPGLEQQLVPLQQGGTGVDSLATNQPDQMPERFEAGSLNLPAIAGLGATVKYLEEQTTAAISKHHQQLIQQLLDGLANIPSINLVGPTANQPRVAVVSCQTKNFDSQEFAAALDASRKIECRAGLHCAPKMHQALNTIQTGGVVRFSPGWSTTPAEIDQALEAIAALASVAIP